jgi:hypothetical protein
MARNQQHYGEGNREWRSDEGRSNRFRDGNEGRYGGAADDRDVEMDYRYLRHSGRVGDDPLEVGPGGRQGGYGGNFGEGRYGPGGSLSRFEMADHRGKGPKNYQRTDERLRELICERLHDHPDIDASDIEVDIRDGTVVLEGTVDSRRTRDLVEDVAEQLSVTDVRSNLRVRRQPQSSRF